MSRVVALGLLFYTSTIFTFGQVQITEVMYDPSGSDTGREWVEVQNIGGSTIDFTTWKFFEANVNHGIDQLDGYSVELNPGEYGVVVSDKAKFLVDFPNFVGKIFKSSFSLSNSGENIAFKAEPSGAIIDQYLYNVSLGATGDGNSLQKNETSWFAALPTPGLANSGGSSGGNTGSTSDTTTTATSTSQTGGTISTTATSTTTQTSSTTPPVNSPVVTGSGGSYVVSQLFGAIILPQVALAGVDTLLQGQGFLLGGKSVQNPRFGWNFGDGTIGQGASTTHRYKYPGTYHVALDVTATMNNNETSVLEHANIVVVAPDVSIEEGKDENGEVYIKIQNETKYTLEISSWVVQRGNVGGEHYILPKNTFIAPFTEIRISQDVTNFKNDGVLRLVELLFPNRKIAAQYDPIESAPKITSTESKSPPLVTNTIQSASVPQPTIAKKVVSNQNGVVTQPIKTPLQDSVKGREEKTIEQATSSSSTVDFMAAAVTTSKQNGTSVLWYALPLLALVIGASVFLSSKKEPSVFEEYTIIEDGK